MSLRKLIEMDVVSHNKYLRDTVQTMDIMTLLRNCHPLYRADYTYRLLREEAITRDEAKEFVKLVGG